MFERGGGERVGVGVAFLRSLLMMRNFGMGLLCCALPADDSARDVDVLLKLCNGGFEPVLLLLLFPTLGWSRPDAALCVVVPPLQHQVRQPLCRPEEFCDGKLVELFDTHKYAAP